MTLHQDQIILIIEDNDDDFFATMRTFKNANLLNPVRRCTNGDQALDYLFRRESFSGPNLAPRPGLILLDLNLPGTDGHEVLRRINEDPVLNEIPVIVLTTSNSRQDIERCYAAGANCFVHKPVELSEFIRSISRLTNYWFNASIQPGAAACR